MSRVDRAALRFDVRPGSTYAPCANRVIMYSRSAPWPVVGVKRGGPRGVRTVTDVNYPSCVCVRACVHVGGRKEPRVVLVLHPHRERARFSLSLSVHAFEPVTWSTRSNSVQLPPNTRILLPSFFRFEDFTQPRTLKFPRKFRRIFSFSSLLPEI